MIVQTAERISHLELSDNVIFQRSVFAYHEASKLVSKTLLEIGTGMGYGFEILAPVVEKYIAIDKYTSSIIQKNINNENFKFIQTTVPPFKQIADQSVDFVVTFQVIEHIKDDEFFAAEISRVLKEGGKAIITTPNKPMSLTRNPWHIREYSIETVNKLLSKYFSNVEVLGVYGNAEVNDYYERNKQSVKKFTRFDVLNLQYLLPRQLLQIPYDLLNRINRKKLLNENKEVSQISYKDYHVKNADNTCFDLFVIVTK